MSLVDQFQQSVLFRWKEMGRWPKQSIWKSFFYLLVLVLLSSIIISAWSFYKTSRIDYRNLLKEMPEFQFTQQHFIYNGESLIVPVPVYDLSIVVSNQPGINAAMNGYVLEFEKDGFHIIKHNLIGSDKLTSYKKLPIWNGKKMYTKESVINIFESNKDMLLTIAFLYQYTKAVLLLVACSLFISIFSLIALPLARNSNLNYKTLWTYSAYSLTLPIVIRTLLNLANLYISFFNVLFCFIDILLVYLVLKAKNALENY